MTNPRYLEDSYERRFETTVTHSADDRLTLDETLFYPKGGGQPTDRGVLASNGDEWRVTAVEKSDEIYHRLAPMDTASDSDSDSNSDSGSKPDGNRDRESRDDIVLPEPGAEITGAIDWERRYAHMRYHTAQHLLSALLLEEYDAATTGNQLYSDRARIDVSYDRFTEADCGAIERRMNDLVAERLPVESYAIDRERAERDLDPERTRLDLLPASVTEVRIVEINGYDRTACAGTHVTNTEEIGDVSVTGRETRGNGGERLRFVLGAQEG